MKDDLIRRQDLLNKCLTEYALVGDFLESLPEGSTTQEKLDNMTALAVELSKAIRNIIYEINNAPAAE